MNQLSRRLHHHVFALGIVATIACGADDRADEANSAWTPAAANEVLGVARQGIVDAIETRLNADPPGPISADRWKHVRRLYANYDGAPLWLAADGFNEPRSNALLRAIVAANADALQLDRYPLTELVASLSAVRRERSSTAAELAAADVLLTSAYVALAEDLLSGQYDPRKLAQDWHVDPERERVDSAVARSLREPRLDSAIATMRPRDPEYAALSQTLVRFRPIVAQGGWPTVPAGRALRRGESDAPARLLALRQRLTAEGLLPPAAAGSAAYDGPVATAVAQFQARHGIVVDSMLGPETVEALNVPARYRLAQIAANLERYRWLPRALGSRYVIVNVPAFRLEAYDGGDKTMEMKVIVGAEFEGRRTPVFADSMEYVVFRPYWNVTPDIQRQELEPKFASNPGFMAANDYEYWNDGGVRRIRQRPGESNSLGLMKFMFPNSFNIYLHDTPQDELFAKDVRAFSHGCIRLERPEEFARWVLGWDAARVEQMKTGPDNQTVRLPKKIPVYIAYFTTYTRDGVLYFGNDLYSRDDALVQAVAGGAFPSAAALQAVQSLGKLVDG